jgi:hypothetical protein
MEKLISDIKGKSPTFWLGVMGVAIIGYLAYVTYYNPGDYNPYHRIPDAGK